jgi:hypothetical protein
LTSCIRPGIRRKLAVSVAEQLTIEGEEEDDGLTWHEWILSLPPGPGDEEREPDKPWLEEAK